MKTQHAGFYLESQLPALTGRSARPLQYIAASACPLGDYESAVRLKSGPEVSTEPITVRIQTFRNHLGRHLEQLALFVLPTREVIEHTDDTTKSDATNKGEGVMSGRAAESDNSEALGSDTDAQKANIPCYLDFDGDQLAEQKMGGIDLASVNSTLGATRLCKVWGAKFISSTNDITRIFCVNQETC